MLVRGGYAFLDIAREACLDELDRVSEQAFVDAMDIGLDNTARTLLLAGVKDDVATQSIQSVWGIDKMEAASRIAFAKKGLALAGIEEYLVANGHDSASIKKLKRESELPIKLGRDPELLSLWNKPEALYKKVSAK